MKTLVHPVPSSVSRGAAFPVPGGVNSSSPSGPSSILPSELTELQYWLDAADETTLFDSVTGGSPSVDNGQVFRWEDKAGSGIHTTRFTSYPTKRENELNGKSVVDLPGGTIISGLSTHGLGITTSSTIFNILGGKSIYIVFRKSNGWRIMQRSDAFPNADDGWYISDHMGLAINTKFCAYPDSPIQADEWMIMHLEFDGRYQRFYKNGTLITPGTNPQNGAAVVGDTVDYGTGLVENQNNVYIGHRHPGAAFITGMFAEIIFFSAPLTEEQRLGIDAYLWNKWFVAPPVTFDSTSVTFDSTTAFTFDEDN